MEKVAIVGAGEFGIQAAHFININNLTNPTCEIVGWFDDTKENGELINGYKILGGTEDILEAHNLGEFDKLFIAIGYNHPEFKEKLISKYKGKIPFLNIISPNTFVDPTAILGENIMLYPGVILDKECHLNDGVTVNIGSIICHNVEVGTCTFIAANATMAGFSSIGKCSFVGLSSTIIDNVSVCENCKIGAGSLIIKDIAQQGTYFGVPARRIG